ncbi:MAG: hypothetical protein J6V55_00035 [Alistipes sp.]|nr:hypothetical protein [Alistipes sp.]
MKQVIIFATLLMVGCGSKQQQSENIDPATEITTPKKVSVKGEKKPLTKLKANTPDIKPVDIRVVTADKDMEYIKKQLPVPQSEE